MSTIEYSYTTNGEIAYKSSGDLRVDLFFNCNRKTTIETEGDSHDYELFKRCYGQYPKEALQILSFTRDCVTGKGKGERQVVFNILVHMFFDDYQTFQKNVWNIASKYGRYRDIVVIVTMINELYQSESYKYGIRKISDDLDFLFTKVADRLKTDQISAESNEEISFTSLCAKWMPSQTCKRYNYFYKSLRNKLFPYLKYQDRDYRKLMTGLKTHLNVVEKRMSANQWQTINFSTVPSGAMRIYGREKCCFAKHDKERFGMYLEDVKNGVKKINTNGLQPHQLVKEASDNNDVIELQWKTLCEKLKSNPNGLENAYAVVDVSGSMTSSIKGTSTTPLDVAVSLGLIINEITGNDVITFSSEPEWHNIEGNTLYEKCNNLKRANWGMNTNIQKVFEMLLETGNKNPMTLFIFSDMQFDTAIKEKDTDTLYENYSRIFREKEMIMPKVVYWNLNDASNTVPVRFDTTGTALISGFSSDLLNVFLNGDDLTPISIVLKSISSYDVVL